MSVASATSKVDNSSERLLSSPPPTESSEACSTAVSTTGVESNSTLSLTSCAYTRDVATLCSNSTAAANHDKNLFMFLQERNKK